MFRFIFSYLLAFHPNWWIMNYDYSSAWDKKFRELLSKHKFTRIGRHTAYLGNHCVWISNYPYAVFHIYDELTVRPSRATIYFAKQKLEQDYFENIDSV